MVRWNHSEMFEKPKRFETPSGLIHTWRLWRHCCCRYGFYPLIVAPIITSGCLLSIYAAAGCDFIRVNVGFAPSNPAWNQSTAEIGMFLYQSGIPETNQIREALLGGCHTYGADFSATFIDQDRTWKVARVMCYIAAVASTMATVSQCMSFPKITAASKSVWLKVNVR